MNSVSIEKRVTTKVRRGQIKTAILQIVAATGVVALAVTAPNTLKAVPRRTLDLVFRGPRNSRDVAVSRLVRQGFLTREMHKGKKTLRITTKGSQYLEHEQRKHALMRPSRWDKHWRIVAFDIGEKRRKVRDALRRELRNAQFHRLQDSMWVYPFPCEEFIALLKADLKVGRDILYIVAREIENDLWLKRHFALSDD